MNPRINQLVKSLLQKDTLDQCTLPELQQFAERHPYFGAAQLLLTKKMQTDNPEQYNEQLQKTFLFFHNPLWVENLLNDTGNGEIQKARKETPAEESAKPETVIVADETTFVKTETEPAVVLPVEAIPAAEIAKAEVVPTATISSAPAENAPSEQNANGISSGIAELKIEPVTPPKEELLFEPFHTVDYFASQGIKFREEEKPKDKFGQQLKSFTEWLKTMKRLPVAEIAVSSEPAIEKKVEEMAEKSIREREVLTEAMAEVWEKQGNAVKAIDIYSKLSLLEPSKSAYFAAKIEDLKKLN